MIYQFHICEGLSDEAVRGLIKTEEPTLKGLKGYALGLLVYDVDEINADIVSGKTEGFTSQDISSIKYLIDTPDVKFIAVYDPDDE